MTLTDVKQLVILLYLLSAEIFFSKYWASELEERSTSFRHLLKYSNYLTCSTNGKYYLTNELLWMKMTAKYGVKYKRNMILVINQNRWSINWSLNVCSVYISHSEILVNMSAGLHWHSSTECPLWCCQNMFYFTELVWLKIILNYCCSFMLEKFTEWVSQQVVKWE